MNHIIKKLPTIPISKIQMQVPLVKLIHVDKSGEQIGKATLSKDGCDKVTLSKQNDSNPEVKKKYYKIFAKKQLRSKHQQELSLIGAKNEAAVYNKIIPLLKVYVPLPVPHCYSADCTQLELEDLGESNYKPFHLNRKKMSITKPQCKFTLKALAKFHGASMILKHKNGADFKMLTKDVLYNYTDLELLKHQQNMLQCILSLYKNIREPTEKYKTNIEALKHLIKVAKNGFNDLLSYEQNKYVFCHGNLLLTNLLNKPIEKQTKGKRDLDIKFVDFQKVHYSSVANDLVYLLFVNLEPNDYIDYKDCLLSTYLQCLIDCTEEWGLNRNDLTLNSEWLYTEIDRFTEYGIINALWFIFICKINDNNNNNNNIDGRELTKEEIDENLKKLSLNKKLTTWMNHYSAEIFKKKSQEQLFVV